MEKSIFRCYIAHKYVHCFQIFKIHVWFENGMPRNFKWLLDGLFCNRLVCL